MAVKRMISIKMPEYLVDQIEARARINCRSRDAEMRYLLDVGFEAAQDGDFQLSLEFNPCRRMVVRVTDDVLVALEQRSTRLRRSVAVEVVRLVAYAIKVGVERDLALLQEMVAIAAGRRHAPSAVEGVRP